MMITIFNKMAHGIIGAFVIINSYIICFDAGDGTIKQYHWRVIINKRLYFFFYALRWRNNIAIYLPGTVYLDKIFCFLSVVFGTAINYFVSFTVSAFFYHPGNRCKKRVRNILHHHTND